MWAPQKNNTPFREVGVAGSALKPSSIRVTVGSAEQKPLLPVTLCGGSSFFNFFIRLCFPDINSTPCNWLNVFETTHPRCVIAEADRVDPKEIFTPVNCPRNYRLTPPPASDGNSSPSRISRRSITIHPRTRSDVEAVHAANTKGATFICLPGE